MHKGENRAQGAKGEGGMGVGVGKVGRGAPPGSCAGEPEVYNSDNVSDLQFLYSFSTHFFAWMFCSI